MMATAERIAGLPPTETFKTVSEACDILRCGKTKIYTLLDSGELQYLRSGRMIRIPISGLKAFIEAHMTTGAA